MTPMKKAALSQSFADGCHRYGWLINIVTTLVMFSFFMGSMRSDVNTMSDRLSRVERVLDTIMTSKPVIPPK